MARKRKRKSRRAAPKRVKGFFRTVGRGVEALLISAGRAVLFGVTAFGLAHAYSASSALLSGVIVASVAFLYALGRNYKP